VSQQFTPHDPSVATNLAAVLAVSAPNLKITEQGRRIVEDRGPEWRSCVGRPTRFNPGNLVR